MIQSSIFNVIFRHKIRCLPTIQTVYQQFKQFTVLHCGEWQYLMMHRMMRTSKIVNIILIWLNESSVQSTVLNQPNAQSHRKYFHLILNCHLIVFLLLAYKSVSLANKIEKCE